MANTPKNLASAHLEAGENTVYTVPAGATAIIGYISVVNTTGSPVTLNITKAGYYWAYGESLDANGGAWEFKGTAVMNATQILLMEADATGLDAFVDGFEHT